MNKQNNKETKEDLEIIRRSKNYRNWRKSVVERDKHTCQKCGATNAILHVHHIKDFNSYPDLRFNIDNGKTLCISCHMKEDNFDGLRRYFGKKVKFSKPKILSNDHY